MAEYIPLSRQFLCKRFIDKQGILIPLSLHKSVDKVAFRVRVYNGHGFERLTRHIFVHDKSELKHEVEKNKANSCSNNTPYFKATNDIYEALYGQNGVFKDTTETLTVELIEQNIEKIEQKLIEGHEYELHTIAICKTKEKMGIMEQKMGKMKSKSEYSTENDTPSPDLKTETTPQKFPKTTSCSIM